MLGVVFKNKTNENYPLPNLKEKKDFPASCVLYVCVCVCVYDYAGPVSMQMCVCVCVFVCILMKITMVLYNLFYMLYHLDPKSNK